MFNYCTLFDSVYLSRGIAMYDSLKKHSAEFHLYIFAFDEISFNILQSLALENATTISLKEFETPDLLEVKKSRSKGEYCWTCTPSTISYVINELHLPNCTYLDSDLIFYSDPAILIDEMIENHRNVLITEHRFSPLAKLYELKRAGRFCVQFVTFTNDPDSLQVLDKWRLQCIDWCYARHEDGKFGDQKYLDEWPLIYNNVHILNNLGGGVAPWNLQQYNFKKNGDSIEGRARKYGQQFQVVFFHFQYVKRMQKGYYDIGWYNISDSVKKLFYLPYLAIIENTEDKLLAGNEYYKPVFSSFDTSGLKSLVKNVFKNNLRYNLVKTQI